jgi:hypothetical protein
MIGSGTVYAFGVLGASAALYLALRVWAGQSRGVAGGVAILAFGLVVGTLLSAGMVGWLDASVALAGGVPGRWIFEPPHPVEANSVERQPTDAASAAVAKSPLVTVDLAGHAPGPGDSLHLVLHQIERRADLALQEAQALDNKAGFILGAASFLLLGVGGLQGVVASHMMDRTLVHAVQWLAVGSVLIYLGVVSAALTAYMVHESVIAPEPAPFDAAYRALPAEQTSAFLAQALLRSYQANQQIVEKKMRWTRRALRAFLAESVFLALILVAIAVTL